MAEKFSHMNEWRVEMSGGRHVEFCPKMLEVRIKVVRRSENPHGDESAWRSITNQLTTIVATQL